MSAITVIAALSDTKSLYLLSKIVSAEFDSQSLLYETGLSKKAFYYRIHSLLKAGIIFRKHGKYTLSSFGKVIYETVYLISTALDNYWRLSALDSLSMLDALPVTEYDKMIETLVYDKRIKNVLARRIEVRDNEPQICSAMRPIMKPAKVGVGGFQDG